MDFKGKRVLVIGLARSGIAASKYLCAQGALVTVQDNKSAELLEDAAAKLCGLPVRLVFGGDPVSLVADADLLVISPGVPVDSPVILAAREQGAPVWGEVELAYRVARADILAITGTNGKTTSTALLGAMLEADGRQSAVAGNIGTALMEVAPDLGEKAAIAAEISSFQLETVEQFRPKVAAILNLTPDHLNRHKTMENYLAVKARIFTQQQPEDTAVLNADDPYLMTLSGRLLSRVWLFSRRQEVAQGCFVRDGIVLCRCLNREFPLIETSKIRIAGPQNLENALAVACMALAYGVRPQAVRDTLMKFAAIEHRFEPVCEVNGRQFINDSKATNPDSTIKAVEAMDRPTVIILGGSDKGSDFSQMAEAIKKGPILACVLVGYTADKIETALRTAGYERVRRAANFQQAVDLAYSLAPEGGSVLLSPACASFDFFRDYEERGRVFKSLARAYLEGVR